MSAPLPPPPAGWYQTTPGIECWWDGYRWTEHTRPIQPVAATRAEVAPVRVVRQKRQKAVTYSPVQTSHTFHLIMTLLTCGLWLLVWIPMIIVNAMRRKKTVTRY
jgi:hypothetical protein